jgi:hypothetical protein
VRGHFYPRKRGDDGDKPWVMLLDVVSQSREDERGLPLPPWRALFCCGRSAPYCEDCPSHPNQKEG